MSPLSPRTASTTPSKSVIGSCSRGRGGRGGWLVADIRTSFAIAIYGAWLAPSESLKTLAVHGLHHYTQSGQLRLGATSYCLPQCLPERSSHGCAASHGEGFTFVVTGKPGCEGFPRSGCMRGYPVLVLRTAVPRHARAGADCGRARHLVRPHPS